MLLSKTFWSLCHIWGWSGVGGVEMKARLSPLTAPNPAPAKTISAGTSAGCWLPPSALFTPRVSPAITDHSCYVDPDVDKNDKAQQQEQEVLHILGTFLVLMAAPQVVRPELIFHGGGVLGPPGPPAAPPPTSPDPYCTHGGTWDTYQQVRERGHNEACCRESQCRGGMSFIHSAGP